MTDPLPDVEDYAAAPAPEQAPIPSRRGSVSNNPDEPDPGAGVCDTCGNRYDKVFTVTQGNKTGTFDSFECAIQAMAPACSYCRCRIIGHGVERSGTFYCCANCARQTGNDHPIDRTRT